MTRTRLWCTSRRHSTTTGHHRKTENRVNAGPAVRQRKEREQYRSRRSTVERKLVSITVVRPRNVVSVAQVRAVLEGIAEEYPWRRDQRQREEHPPRYVEWGKPNCLVAMALLRLGFSLGLLRALDAEHPVGDLFQPGVRIAESRHPALARLDPAALALLAHVQEAQCRGRSWGRIVRDAFARSKWFPGRDLERKPWLTI